MKFREVLKSKPKGLQPQLCRSQSSPTCLYNFIQSRYGQVSCYNCLVHDDLLDAHPLIKSTDPDDDFDDTFVNQLW